jgi:hypothetical protein
MKSKYGDDDGQYPLSLYSSPSLCRHHSLEVKLFVRLIVVLVYALSLSLVWMLSLVDALSPSLADALSPSLADDLSLSHTDALSLANPLSLSILWFVVIFTLVVFSSLTMASIWIDRAVVALRSFRPDLLVLLFLHASGFVHISFIHSNVL